MLDVNFQMLLGAGLIVYLSLALGLTMMLGVLREQAELRWWAASTWASVVGVLLMAWPGDPLVPWPVLLARNLAMGATGLLVLCGIARYLRRRVPLVSGLALLGAYITAVVWFTWYAPDRPLRYALFGVLSMAWDVWAIVLLVRRDGAGISIGRRIAASVLAVAALLWAARTGLRPWTLPAAGGLVLVTYLGNVVLLGAKYLALLMLLFERQLAELRVLARTDGLTRVLNRGAVLADGRAQLAACRRTRQPFSALMFDLDHFKRVNDTFGHQAGDAALRHAVDVLQRGIRRSDALFGRYGGEEFVLFLPGVEAVGAAEIARRLRTELEAQPLQLGTRHIVLTASVGVGMAAAADDLDAVLARADEGVYAAKATGRNRVAASTG